jgi:hypothetical protein
LSSIGQRNFLLGVLHLGVSPSGNWTLMCFESRIQCFGYTFLPSTAA